MTRTQNGRRVRRSPKQHATAATKPRKPAEPDRIQPADNPLAKLLDNGASVGTLTGISKAKLYEWAEGAHRFMLQGQWRRARSAFELLLRIDPTDAYLLAALGTIAEQEKRHDEAEQYYGRALESDPSAAHVFANRGGLRVAMGKIEAAIQDLERAIGLDPKAELPAVRRAVAMRAALRTQAQLSLSPDTLRQPEPTNIQTSARRPKQASKIRRNPARRHRLRTEAED